MEKKLRLFSKDGKVLKTSNAIEDKTGQIVIDNLTPNTTYNDGDFKVSWVIDGKESSKADVPGFKTLDNPERIVVVTFNGLDELDTEALKGQDGADGEDGKSITVISSDLDEQGNTVITFSDNTKVTVNKGKDGQEGKSFDVSDLTEDDYKKILDYGIANGYFKQQENTENIVMSETEPEDKSKIWIDTSNQ
ncbi:tail protein [Staphylococcus phage vB_SepS_BE22]|nr:tail protein [Staphylococcus phage vB_SepS_BE22]